MANIKVNDLLELNLAGTELFNDSESFMKELSEESEQMEVIGGSVVGCLLPTCRQTGISHITPIPVVFNQ
ncbi:hypothetical protein [Coleofasciculus sp.]|uniref:hypothetical protein n=1 Tax=Coleofasciculus sp. TaxID=3100458 RepID=UPI0039FB87E3